MVLNISEGVERETVSLIQNILIRQFDEWETRAASYWRKLLCSTEERQRDLWESIEELPKVINGAFTFPETCTRVDYSFI